MSQTSSVASKFFIPQINKANQVVRVHEQRQRRPRQSRLFQATGLVNLVSSSTHGAVQMPVRPKGQCQRAGTSVQEPPSRSFKNPPSLQGFRARAVLCSRLKLRSAATLPLRPASFPEQTLLTLEALFQLTEDCVSHLFCVLVEALTVL